MVISLTEVLRPTSAGGGGGGAVEKLWGLSTISHIGGGYVFILLMSRSS